MQHLWFRILDAGATKRARAVAARSSVSVYASEVADRAPVGDLPLQVVPVSITLDDEHGRNIRARCEELMAIVSCRASANDEPGGWLPSRQLSWSAEWHRILGAHYYELCKPLLEFLAIVERAYRTKAIETPDRILIDLGRHAGVPAVLAHGKSELKFPAPFDMRGTSPDARLGAIAEVIRLARRTARIRAKRLLGRGPYRERQPEINIDSSAGSIVLVQHEPEMMDRLPLGATQDWIEASGLSPRRIVYYFNRANSRLDAVARSALARRGFGSVDYSGPADHVQDADALQLNCAAQLIEALRSVRSRDGLARWMLLAEILPQVERHREFLRTHRVVGVHQHGEFVPGQMALNLACRQEGAAFFWGFWSALVFLSGWYHYAFADLVFAWGSYDVGHDNALSFDYRYAVQCGILGYDGREPNDRDNAVVLRARLTARPRFVITLFDSSHHSSVIHHGTENCAAFYRIVLALVRDNPDWGCLIKSKGPAYDELPVQPGLQDVAGHLEAEGRCLRLPHAIKPTLAALASDAVVCFSVNSAGIQAAVGSGRPTLHFDPNNLTMHPLSVAGGDGKIIFRDAETFCAALRALAAGDRRFGDLAPWANLFDPFQDGMGRRRSGEVMRDYMAARDRGLSRDEALRAAAEGHVARYGDALATIRCAPHDSAGDQLWRRVRELHYPDWPPDMPFANDDPVSAIGAAEDVAA